MTDAVKLERDGEHILIIRLNRPEKRNAVNGAVATAISAAVLESETDNAIRAVVLASTGDQSFSAGADLAEVAAGRASLLSTSEGGFAGLIEAKRSRPWIAAVDAPALGGGFELCLACDMIVASERASFGLPEVKRGLFAGAAGVFRAPRALPKNVALEMIATGEPLGAARAHALGLINRITPPGEALEVALTIARSIAGNAPLAVRESLAIARQAADLDERALFSAMRSAGSRIRDSEDAREGTRAFLERRPPIWAS